MGVLGLQSTAWRAAFSSLAAVPAAKSDESASSVSAVAPATPLAPAISARPATWLFFAPFIGGAIPIQIVAVCS
jgi:hypothetical protein